MFCSGLQRLDVKCPARRANQGLAERSATAAAAIVSSTLPVREAVAYVEVRRKLVEFAAARPGFMSVEANALRGKACVQHMSRARFFGGRLCPTLSVAWRPRAKGACCTVAMIGAVCEAHKAPTTLSFSAHGYIIARQSASP